jgi:hypothetical protein
MDNGKEIKALFWTLLAGALAPTTPAQGISSPGNPQISRNKEQAGSALEVERMK